LIPNDDNVADTAIGVDNAVAAAERVPFAEQGHIRFVIWMLVRQHKFSSRHDVAWLVPMHPRHFS